MPTTCVPLHQGGMPGRIISSLRLYYSSQTLMPLPFLPCADDLFSYDWHHDSNEGGQHSARSTGTTATAGAPLPQQQARQPPGMSPFQAMGKAAGGGGSGGGPNMA